MHAEEETPKTQLERLGSVVPTLPAILATFATTCFDAIIRPPGGVAMKRIQTPYQEPRKLLIRLNFYVWISRIGQELCI